MTADRQRASGAFTVTILGSSGTYPGPGGACSGYLLRTPHTTVWLDAGPGTLANVQQHVKLGDIDALVLSHEHPDHWIELPVLRHVLVYELGRDGLPTYGTAGTRELADAVTRGRVAPTFAWHDLSEGDQITIGDISLGFARTDHPVETLAVRAEAHGRVLGYSADTGPRFQLSALDSGGRGFDLALVDATFTDAQASDAGDDAVHLSARQAGALAERSGVDKLLVTHLYPGRDLREAVDDAASVFDGPVEAAVIGDHHDV